LLGSVFYNFPVPLNENIYMLENKEPWEIYGPNAGDVINVGHFVNIQFIIYRPAGHLVFCDSGM